MTVDSTQLPVGKNEKIKRRSSSVYFKHVKRVVVLFLIVFLIVYVWIASVENYLVRQITESGGKVWYSSEMEITESVSLLVHGETAISAAPNTAWEESPHGWKRIIFPTVVRDFANEWLFGQTSNFTDHVDAVRLDECLLSVDLFNHLQRLKDVRWLSLYKSTFDPNDANSFFENAVALEWLIAGNTPLNDTHIRLMSNCRRLRWLDIQSTQVTDSGLSELGQFENLRFLDASDTQITDAGVKYIAKNSNLIELQLNYTAISDEGIKHLVHLNFLERLSLRDTSISKKALKSIQQLPRLKYLDVSGTEITDEQIKEYRKAAPNVTIFGGKWFSL